MSYKEILDQFIFLESLLKSDCPILSFAEIVYVIL